ncbi:MAG: hypothetical protein ABW221_25415 [Vicinamibacteria bacterium]
MRTKVAVLALAALTPITAQAMAHRPYPGDVPPGSLVDVSVEVEGAERPLYAAPDGGGRLYFEARRGARYAIRLHNRSHERVGVVVQVDGLNVISGDRTQAGWLGSSPGRMYVLDAWETTEVKGWRTSLDEVRRFTFVEEERSYASRSGQANNKTGWVEIAVYRERHRAVSRRYNDGRPDTSSRDLPFEGGAEAGAAPAAEAPRDAEKRASDAYRESGGARRPEAQSYPGTGWGQATDDRVVVVDFEPERTPAQRITLRYEYASGLRALGIDVRPAYTRDRLRERDRGQGGFAKPPAW